MAAPAFAASVQDWAISAGETGTAGLRLGESAEPVTAQEIMTLRCITGGFLVAGTAPVRIFRHLGFLCSTPARTDANWRRRRPPGSRVLMYHGKFGPTGQTQGC